MILYNMRYRGPYEYEKTILNVFQFHNEIMDLKNELESTSISTLKSALNKLELLAARAEEIENSISLQREVSKTR